MSVLLRVLALCLALLPMVAGADSAAQRRQLLFGHDDRVAIDDNSVAPYAAIGKLEMQSGARCSATLIAPDLVATAAHCFATEPGRVDRPVSFMAGYRDGRGQAIYRATGMQVPPGFRHGVHQVGERLFIRTRAAPFDIALVRVTRLRGRADIAPMPAFDGDRDALRDALTRRDNRVEQAGYAYDHREQLYTHRDCRVTALNDDNTLSHRCDTLSGDSGSPIWLETADGPRLIAVQSAAPTADRRASADNTAVTLLQIASRP